MNRLKVIIFIIWFIAGVLTLFGGNISAADYAFIWITLIVNLFIDIHKV